MEIRTNILEINYSVLFIIVCYTIMIIVYMFAICANYYYRAKKIPKGDPKTEINFYIICFRVKEGCRMLFNDMFRPVKSFKTSLLLLLF